MDKIDILLWAVGGGFAGTWMLMFYLVKHIREDLKDMRKELQDIDRRLCRLEGAFSSKEFRVLKNETYHKKAD